MTELFNRRAVLQMGTVRVEGLRTSFKVEKTAEIEPNTAEISVWNLSKDTRSSFASQKGVPVILQVGYGEDLAQVSSGDIAPSGISTVRSGPDWVTTFRAGDGGDDYRTARVSLSLAKGAKLKDVLKGIAGQLKTDVKGFMTKVDSGEIKDTGGALTEFFSGVVANGRAMDELNRILGGMGYSCSVQDGKLEVVAKGAFEQEEVPLLTPASGLIGSPEPGKDGLVKFRSLLQPAIKPLRRVKVESASHNGIFLVSKVTHLGDTGGADWYSDCEGKPL